MSGGLDLQLGLLSVRAGSGGAGPDRGYLLDSGSDRFETSDGDLLTVLDI